MEEVGRELATQGTIVRGAEWMRDLGVDNLPRVELSNSGRAAKATTVQEWAERGAFRDNEAAVAMARMLLELKGLQPSELPNTPLSELAKRARPAGYAVAFAEEPVLGEKFDRNLLEGGMIVFGSPIIKDGEPSFVAIDKRGVFLIQAKVASEKNEFLDRMWNTLDRVDDQRNNFCVRTKRGFANARAWEGVTVVDVGSDSAAEVLLAASKASLEHPFVSSRDVAIAKAAEEEAKRDQENLGESQQDMPPLGDIEF